MKAPRSAGAFSFTFAFMAFAFSIAIAFDSFTTLSTWTPRTGQATRVTTSGARGKGIFFFPIKVTKRSSVLGGVNMKDMNKSILPE